MSRMTVPESMLEPLKLMIIPFGMPMNVWKFVDAMTAPPVPPTISRSAGMFMKAIGFVPSMMLASRSAPNAHTMPMAVMAFTGFRSFG
jgi:hypothetical protein